MQLSNLRMGLAGRLAAPKLTPEQTVTVIGMISRYFDSHWADYLAVPKPDAAKRAQVLELHEALTDVMNGVGALYNTLREASAPH